MGAEKIEQGVRAAKDHQSYADGAAFVDGRFVRVAEARVPILDWGFLRSDATYDVAHVVRLEHDEPSASANTKLKC